MIIKLIFLNFNAIKREDYGEHINIKNTVGSICLVLLLRCLFDKLHGSHIRVSAFETELHTQFLILLKGAQGGKR